jgi:hypothetical protein
LKKKSVFIAVSGSDGQNASAGEQPAHFLLVLTLESMSSTIPVGG